MSGLALASLLAAAALAPEPARDAASLPPVAVEADGACPTSDAVRAALLPVVAATPAAAQPAPRVSDLGPRFAVVAAGQTGMFVDAERDCVERARVAAVFIALALNPPVPPARPPVVTVEPPLPPPVVSAHGRWFSAALLARFDGAEAGSGGDMDGTWGGELRGALGHGVLGVAATAGMLAPTTSTFGSVTVRQQRFPLSVTLALQRDLPARFRLGGDVGVALVPFTLEGQGLETVAPATRVDVGGRLSVEVRFPPLGGELTPVLGLHAEYFPRPYALVVDPLGDVGTSSSLWLGTSLGLAFETDRRR